MRKTCALLLAMVMTMSVAVTALAEEDVLILQDEIVIEEADEYVTDDIVVEDASGELVDEETRAAVIEEYLADDEMIAEEDAVAEISDEEIVEEVQTTDDTIEAADESDTKKKAKKINIKKLTKGSVNKYGDYDYFKFVTDVEAKYTFELKTDLKYAHFQVVEDSAKGILCDEALKAGKTNTVTITLSGETTYWVCIYDVYENKGAYSFKAKSIKDLKIRPSVKKLKAGKGSIEVTLDGNWKKVDKTILYWSTDKKMKKPSYAAIGKNYKGKAVIKGLKKNKNYYIQVIGYTTVVYKGDRYNLYTKASKIKSIKTK